MLLTDGSSKRVLALDSSVASADVTFIFMAIHAGVYEPSTPRTRESAAALVSSASASRASPSL